MIDSQERFSEKKNFFNRLILIYVIFAALFILIIYKTYSLQVSSFSDYEIAALKNKTREILIQPSRGIIYDRDGQILVNNVPSYNLIIKPSFISNFENLLDEIKSIKMTYLNLGHLNHKYFLSLSETLIFLLLT